MVLFVIPLIVQLLVQNNGYWQLNDSILLSFTYPHKKLMIYKNLKMVHTVINNLFLKCPNYKLLRHSKKDILNL